MGIIISQCKDHFEPLSKNGMSLFGLKPCSSDVSSVSYHEAFGVDIQPLGFFCHEIFVFLRVPSCMSLGPLHSWLKSKEDP